MKEENKKNIACKEVKLSAIFSVILLLLSISAIKQGKILSFLIGIIQIGLFVYTILVCLNYIPAKKEGLHKLTFKIACLLTIAFIAFVNVTIDPESLDSEDEEEKIEEIVKTTSMTSKKEIEEEYTIAADTYQLDQDVLYKYGKYYDGKTVLTVVEIKDADKSSKVLKATSPNNDGLMYSFIFNFNKEIEMKNYKEGETIIIQGKIDKSKMLVGKTVELINCKVLAKGELATSKKEELKNNKESQLQAAQELELLEKAKQQEAEQAKKDNYKTECNTLNYNDIQRNPDDYKKQKIKIYGTIIQVSEGWFNSVTFRVKDLNGNIWYVSYNYSDRESKFLENDKVNIYGTSTGTKTYTTVLGNSVTIPSISAKYIEN